MINEFFKTNVHMALVYNVTDLTSLKYPGDKNMHTLRHQWGMILASMADNLGDKTLATIFLQKLEHSTELKGGGD